MIEQNVEELLNKLESNISMAKKSFFNDTKQVDEGACLDCISQIRALLPSELSEARLIRKDAQNIVANANNQASTIIAKAKADAEKMVAENKIVADATATAEKIVQSANEYADNIVGQAYNEVAKLLDDAEAHAREILNVLLDTKSSIFQYTQNPDLPPQQ